MKFLFDERFFFFFFFFCHATIGGEESSQTVGSFSLVFRCSLSRFDSENFQRKIPTTVEFSRKRASRKFFRSTAELSHLPLRQRTKKKKERKKRETNPGKESPRSWRGLTSLQPPIRTAGPKPARNYPRLSKTLVL